MKKYKLKGLNVKGISRRRHCGVVRFTYSGEKIRKGAYCNCSICVRKGALMNAEPISPANLKIESNNDVLGLYEFGTKTAKHHFCKRCGIHTFPPDPKPTRILPN